jgi:hypothetical protein
MLTRKVVIATPNLYFPSGEILLLFTAIVKQQNQNTSRSSNLLRCGIIIRLIRYVMRIVHSKFYCREMILNYTHDCVENLFHAFGVSLPTLDRCVATASLYYKLLEI